MAIELISKIKPKNNGDFPMVDATDVEMADGTRLEDAAAELASTLTTIGSTVTSLSAGMSHKQSTLVSGQNIKTINGESVLGSGNIEIKGGGGVTSVNGQTGDVTITVTNGKDGEDGADGKDGVSPSVSVTAITGGHRVSITDAGGTKTFDVMDGEDGKDGEDGSGVDITVDDAFNPTSTNPVQNAVITAAMMEAQTALTALAKQTTPVVTTADAGKVLAVNDNGEWVAMEMAVSADLPSAEEASF